MELAMSINSGGVEGIPTDWIIIKLSDLAEIATGNTPPTRDLKNYGSDYLFVSPFDLGDGKWVFNTEKKLSKIGFEKSRKFPKGSILYTCIGSTIGKSGMAPVELTSNQQINAVFPNESYVSDYLFYALARLSKRIKSLAGEQAVPIINKTQFGETLIPLPPTIREQTAIATALSDADALISSLEKLIAKKRAIKQGAMQELLKPKKNWEKKRLGDCVKIMSGESPSKFKFVKDGVPYLKVEQLNNCEKYQTSSPYQIETDNVIPKGSLIFPKRGASILLNKIRILGVNSYMDTNLMTLTIVGDINNEFMYYMLTYIELWRIADTTSIPQINNKHIYSVELELPSLEEQLKVANILSEMDTEVDVLESKLSKYRQIKSGMMQNLLTGKIRLV